MARRTNFSKKYTFGVFVLGSADVTSDPSALNYWSQRIERTQEPIPESDEDDDEPYEARTIRDRFVHAKTWLLNVDEDWKELERDTLVKAKCWFAAFFHIKAKLEEVVNGDIENFALEYFDKTHAISTFFEDQEDASMAFLVPDHEDLFIGSIGIFVSTNRDLSSAVRRDLDRRHIIVFSGDDWEDDIHYEVRSLRNSYKRFF